MDPQRQQYLVWLSLMAISLVFSGLLVLAGVNAGRACAQTVTPTVLTVDQVLSQPYHFLNQQVAVSGEVADVQCSHAFALKGHLVRPGLLLVLNDETAETKVPLNKGQRVQVWGWMRLLSRQEARALEKELSPDLRGEELLALCANHPYILALQIKPQAMKEGANPSPQ